jgi:hypothetical protein
MGPGEAHLAGVRAVSARSLPGTAPAVGVPQHLAYLQQRFDRQDRQTRLIATVAMAATILIFGGQMIRYAVRVSGL